MGLWRTSSEDRRRRPFLTKETGIRLLEMFVGGIIFLVLLQVLLGFSVFDATFWARFWNSYTRGLVGTLVFTAIIIPVSVVIGFLGGWARVSRHRVASWPVAVYVDFFRGIPPLVLIIFAYLFGQDFLPPRVFGRGGAYTVAALALALHSGAYQVEIFRAGFQSIPRGQMEAAHAVGMGQWQSMRHIILPQTLRLSLPPLANEFATVIKDTSLLGVVGATEMFALAQEFQQQMVTFGIGPLVWVFSVWTSVALTYFVMTFLVTRVLLALEHRFHTPGLEALSL